MKKRTATLEEISELFDYEKRWINRLSKEQGLPRLARGKYDLLEVCRADETKAERNPREIFLVGLPIDTVEAAIGTSRRLGLCPDRSTYA